MFTFSGDTVLDPFLGRGTTMQAADELNRSSIGYETGFDSPSEKSWQDVIRERVDYDREPSRFTFNW
jgi:DNA modification methylase